MAPRFSRIRLYHLLLEGIDRDRRNWPDARQEALHRPHPPGLRDHRRPDRSGSAYLLKFPGRSALGELKRRFLFWLKYSFVLVRSWRSRKPLPPGDLRQLSLEDRDFLLQRSQRLGPVFKVVHRESLWICIVGFREARRLLRECADHLQPQDIDLTSLFPEGHLSLMGPEDHQRCRRAFVQAIEAACPARMRQIAADELTLYQRCRDQKAASYLETLRRIATQMLLEHLLGAPPESDYLSKLQAGFQRLGPDGLVWHVGAAQREAFAELLKEVQEVASESLLPGSLLANLRRNESPPERAILGNLLYMVEMGRSDLHHLFRWLSKFAAQEPSFLDRMRREPALARPFVLESLRMAQAEVVVRSVRRDFVFLDHFWPRGALVRICLWEAHQLENSFAEPSTFNPGRFGEEIPKGVYAPFGLDAFGCPFQSTSTQLSEAFLRALCAYQVTPIGNHDPRRGRFHWEPAADFSVALE